MAWKDEHLLLLPYVSGTWAFWPSRIINFKTGGRGNKEDEERGGILLFKRILRDYIRIGIKSFSLRIRDTYLGSKERFARVIN